MNKEQIKYNILNKVYIAKIKGFRMKSLIELKNVSKNIKQRPKLLKRQTILTLQPIKGNL